MKRLFLMFLVLTLLCGCALTPPSPRVQTSPATEALDYPLAPTAKPTAAHRDWPDDGMFTLRYDGDSTLNPYSCGTEVNRLLCSLLYEPMIRVSADFRAESALCTEWATADGGRTFEMTLRENVRFSDGSAMTYWDVLYSLNRAKEETSFYCARLKNVTDFSWTGEKLRVTLALPQPEFPLLMDVPCSSRL